MNAVEVEYAAPPAAIQEALHILGIRRLLLGIQDAAFPCLPEEDIGRGSPYAAGARKFMAFARSLGFNGLQLGPQGMTSPANPSPYDGTLFSRNQLSLAPLPLAQRPGDELLSQELLGELVQGRPQTTQRRTSHGYACQAQRRISEEVWSRYQAKLTNGTGTALAAAFALFRQKNGGWLIRDGLYESLRHYYGGRNWRYWQGGREANLDRQLWHPAPGDEKKAARRRRLLFGEFQQEISAYSFTQFLLHRQHQELRDYAHGLGLDLFGDLQIGFSGRDAWFADSFLLQGYVMGAPPSRTNPEGQPWNYALLDPKRYFTSTGGQPGPALRFLRQRVDKMLREFDGLRIDHPHGLICPWVYRANETDPLAAVQAGARLFASPDLPDHPGLATFSIPRTDQINRDSPRHADDWVHDLDSEQEARYALMLDVIMAAALRNGHDFHAIACEILSTQPYPIKRVMERHGLGRFRVTQKADLENLTDVYRSENADPEDWIMLGNHDTPPIWLLADQWSVSGTARQQAVYLAWRLKPKEEDRDAWVERMTKEAGELVQAKVADLFAGPAGNVMIFFTDLLGMTEIYNRPGTISDDNWSLRISSNFAEEYRKRLTTNRAINIPKALALAIRSRGGTFAKEHDDLLFKLDQLACLPCN